VSGSTEAVYITSLHEVFWGLVMIATVVAIHGAGVIVTLRAGRAMQRAAGGRHSFFHGMGRLVVATLILVLVHLVEVIVWGLFLSAKGAFPNVSTAIYYALMQYTTVSSSLRLPSDLRLLGGIIPLSGMLTVAWSTSVLFLLAQPFVTRYSSDDDQSGSRM
jgi:hypothetical protein